MKQVLPRLVGIVESLDVLIIDDASPDGTGGLAEELRVQFPRLSVLHRKMRTGLGPAYVQGFKVAIERGFDRIVTMDSDLSHAPEDVPRLLAALAEADVVIGSRAVAPEGMKGWSLRRRLLSRVGCQYSRSLLELSAADVTSGFRAYRSEALRAIDLDGIKARGFVFQVEIFRRILDLPGARAVEVPISFRDRTRGRSKLSFKIILEAIWQVAALRFRSRLLPRTWTKGPCEPSISVVIPARPECEEPGALAELKAVSYPPEKLETVVARGYSPAEQRNKAVRATTGKYLLFLDDDCRVSRDLDAYVSVFDSDPTIGAVGGPVLASLGTRFQDLASTVLSDPLVLGRTSSRYQSRGKPRYTDERELILCNLCMRREAFEEVGGFKESLYPNEENELLERLRLAGWKLAYVPEAVVHRPQRESVAALLKAISGYGSGRGAQIRALPSKISLSRLALVGLAVLASTVGVVGVVLGSWALALPLLLYAVYVIGLAGRFSRKVGAWKGTLAALLSALIHGAYAFGVLRGLLFPPRRRPEALMEIKLERR